MSRDGNVWEGEDVPDRQPAYCPYCGQDGAKDGLGQTQNGYRHHCPECGHEFISVLPEETA